MTRRGFLATLPAAAATAADRRTTIAIDGDRFLINGQPTYPGRTYQGMRIEGLLMNSRMVQGAFDDRNPETRQRWAYPDTKKWDAERNTREFLQAMPEWRRHGLLSFTINFQGGSPEGYSKLQPWHNSAFEADGSLRRDYMGRIARILDRADELGMAPIVGYFYFGQDERLKDEAAVKRATENATKWLLSRGYRNLLIEVNNECNVARYEHEILKPPRVHELIEMVKTITAGGRRFLVSTSYGGGAIPTPNVVAASDYLILHGNGVSDPNRITGMVVKTRAVAGYRKMPILFNEDDHFDFEKPVNNMTKAIGEYASWGFFDPEGYQSPPVRWGLDTERKKAFFKLVKEVTGS